MCASTFKAVKDMGRELGCVTKEGLQADMLRGGVSSWSGWWRWVGRPVSRFSSVHVP